MTLDERSKLLDIVATVDARCHTCISNVLDHLEAAFPEHPWREEFGPFDFENIDGRASRAKMLRLKAREEPSPDTEPDPFPGRHPFR